MGFEETVQFVEEEANLFELNDLIKMMRNQIKRVAYQHTWKLGQAVMTIKELQNKIPCDIIGTVVEINKINLKIDFGEYGIHTFPKSIIKQAS